MKKLLLFTIMIFACFSLFGSYIDLGTGFDYGKIQNLWFVNDSAMIKIDTTVSATFYKNKLSVDTILTDSIDARALHTTDLQADSVDANKIYADTLSADSANLSAIYADTIRMHGKKFYNDGTYFQMGYIGASILNSSTNYLYIIKNTYGNPLNIQCGYNYNDSLLFSFTGANSDTIATADSFNHFNFYTPVKFSMPPQLPVCYIPDTNDTLIINSDTLTGSDLKTGMMAIDTSGGDTLKVYLNSVFEAK